METNTQKADSRSQLLFAAAITAAFLVLLYGSIFKGIPMGINVLLFIAVCYGSMLACFDAFHTVLRESVFQTVTVVLLGITFVLYNNLVLLTINAFLIIMIVGAQYRFMLKLQKDPLYSLETIRDACVVWFGYSFAGLPGAFKSMGNSKQSSNVKGVIIGIAIAIPVIAAVLALLVSADAAFSQMLKNTFQDVNAGDAVGYSIVGVLLFVCACGLYYSLKNRKPNLNAAQPKLWNLNKIAMMLVVGCMDVVLAVFAAVQFGYLFSGNVPAGFTYAEYARSGFWQLVGVAVIVAAVVFLVQKSAEVRSGNNKAVKIMLTILCALTEIVLVSAFWRMVTYEQAFLFSILRIFTQAFMIATAGVFLVLAVSFWARDFKLQKWIFIVGMVAYVGLNFLNPDAFIAMQNRAIQKEGADMHYISELSADALPYWADKANEQIDKVLDGGYGRDEYLMDMNNFLIKSLAPIQEGIGKSGSWQYFNLSRENAKSYISAERYLRAKIKLNELKNMPLSQGEQSIQYLP